jgi:hypothetical protein
MFPRTYIIKEDFRIYSLPKSDQFLFWLHRRPAGLRNSDETSSIINIILPSLDSQESVCKCNAPLRPQIFDILLIWPRSTNSVALELIHPLENTEFSSRRWQLDCAQWWPLRQDSKYTGFEHAFCIWNIILGFPRPSHGRLNLMKKRSWKLSMIESYAPYPSYHDQNGNWRPSLLGRDLRFSGGEISGGLVVVGLYSKTLCHIRATVKFWIGNPQQNLTPLWVAKSSNIAVKALRTSFSSVGQIVFE